MKEVFLDTNIFLRFFVDGKNKQHEDCVRLFKLIEEGKIRPVICSVVFLEIYFTLRSFYNIPNKRCEDFLKRILELDNLKIADNYDYDKAWQSFHSTGVKFADCLIASLKFFEEDKTIISYDKEFDKLKLKRAEPHRLFS